MSLHHSNCRKSTQHLMPATKASAVPGRYDIYPVHPLGDGAISNSWQQLANTITIHPVVLLDGYQGIFFDDIRQTLQPLFDTKGLAVTWLNVATALKDPATIDRLTEPFLGGNDPLFGTRTTLTLADFFDPDRIAKLIPDKSYDIKIFYGTGASLIYPQGFLIYFDLPKNELQYRARAGCITNLGASAPEAIQVMYKRFYFVDWIVLNRHKQNILSQIEIFADGQRPGEVTWATGDTIRQGLTRLSHNFFRVRPWFEPGPWGGQWCRKNVDGLNKDVPNYAWSFELIVPENGLIFESDGFMLEVSFDSLMYHDAEAVLGDCHKRFGTEFPIRFDFLDTFRGGNLSVQCHPQTIYTKSNFNEDFTQEETYYILDAEEDATVYLGFRDDIVPAEYELELTKSFSNGTEADIERFVMKHPARKHDLFLIPPGTVHASGRNTLVLEISTTPYIFTFKMYDWLRPDLSGKPRPLNIKRAMENLRFDRRGSYVTEKLISKPAPISAGPGWEIYHLPTHENHCYDVHRIHLTGTVELSTADKLLVMNLVQGSSIAIETENGETAVYNYAETFVIPAAAGSFKLKNIGKEEAILVKAFIK
jgi:mannose-6-phosphate isomerase class I